MRIAIITGASSGLGSWFALYTAKYMKTIDEIWLFGRNRNKLRSVGQKIIDACDVKCRAFSMDLSENSELKRLERLLIQKEPEIALLINSAGYGMMGGFERIPEAELSGMVRLNCEALTLVSKLCLPYMKRGSGIINMASAAAFLPQSEFAVYAASKSYVLSLSKALYKELKPKGIFVMAVCPGCIDTPFFERAEKYAAMKAFKKLVMAKPQAVVRKACMDAGKGKKVSVYGGAIQLLYILAKFLPDSWLSLFY